MKRYLVVLVVAVVALVAVPAIAYALTGNDPSAPVRWLIDQRDPDTPTNSGSEQPGEPTATPDQDMRKKLAPIESVEILVMESYPPQYSVHVEYGLESGCAKPGGYEVERNGDEIRIKVWVLLPADENVVCTMIYGIDSHNVPLGADFTSGQTYTVDVNGTVETFTAQ